VKTLIEALDRQGETVMSMTPTSFIARRPPDVP
jgi:hypothetical protein